MIDGKTHIIEITLGERDNTEFILQILLLISIIIFLVEISVLTKLLKKKRGKK